MKCCGTSSYNTWVESMENKAFESSPDMIGRGQYRVPESCCVERSLCEQIQYSVDRQDTRIRHEFYSEVICKETMDTNYRLIFFFLRNLFIYRFC